MVARLTVLGSGEEGTGPGVVLSVARVAEYSGEETALMQVHLFSWGSSARWKMMGEWVWEQGSAVAALLPGPMKHARVQS